MLDSLMELEVAYSLMKSSHTSKTGSHIDGHYEQLKTEIDILPKDSQEYKYLCDYVKNTHAQTHASYDLEIDEVSIEIKVNLIYRNLNNVEKSYLNCYRTI